MSARAKEGRPRLLVGLAAVAIVIVALRVAQPLAAPLVLAALVAAASAPMNRWFRARGAPPSLAAGVALLVVLAFLGTFALLLAYCADELRVDLPTYLARISVTGDALAHSLRRIGVPVTSSSLLAVSDPDRIARWLRTGVGAAAALAWDVLIGLLVVFFALYELDDLGHKLRHVLRRPDVALERFDRAVHEVQRYLLLKTALNVLLAVVVGVLLRALRVELALLLALLMFLLHYIPNVGAVLATIPAVAVALAGRGAPIAVAVLAGYTVAIVLIGNMLEPKLMSRTLDLSALVVLLAMIFWGWLWGPVGALLAVPITMVAKIVCENVEGLEHVAMLLGRPPAPPGSPAGRTPLRERGAAV